VSVLVSIRIPADVAKFKQLLASDSDRFASIAEHAKAEGAIHHQFAAGDGYVLVVDEWESAGAFQRFFESPEIAQIMVDAGAQGEPEVVVAEAIDSPDRF